MKGCRRIAALLAAAVVCLLACTPAMASAGGLQSYEGMVSDISREVSAAAGREEPLAIVTDGIESRALASRLALDLERSLVDAGCVVLDRSNVDAIVDELMFQTSGLVDDGRAVSIGHMLGASLMLVVGSSGGSSSLGVDVQLIDVETTLVVRHLSYSVRYDASLLEAIDGGAKGVGDRSFGIGARVGALFGFNKAHGDMIGGSAKPAQRTPVSFAPTLTAFRRVSDTLKVRLELSFLVDTGIEVLGLYEETTARLLDVDVLYSSLDVPVLVSWSFIRRPVDVSVFAGAYVSLPLGAANISYSIEGYGDLKGSVDMAGVTFGGVAGFDVGFDLGPGTLVLDARVFHDAVASKAKGGPIGDEPRGLMHRRGAVVSAGYVFGL